MIPSQLEGRAIRRIGRRACNARLGRPLRIYIEEGIEEIGAQAFDRKLEALHLPSGLRRCGICIEDYPGLKEAEFFLALESREEERQLMRIAAKTRGRYVIRDVSLLAGLKEKADMLGLSVFPAALSDSCFFREKNLLQGEQAAYEAPEAYPLYAPESPDTGFLPLTERDIVLRMIHEGGGGRIPPGQELMTDWISRQGRAKERDGIGQSAVFTFSPEDFEYREGRKLVLFKVERGYFFYPMVKKVSGGRNGAYFVYSRLYPSGGQIFRTDMAVFDSAGNLQEPGREVREAYARYRLLSLL